MRPSCLPFDAQLAHFINERCAWQTQPHRRAISPANQPTRLPQNVRNLTHTGEPAHDGRLRKADRIEHKKRLSLKSTQKAIYPRESAVARSNRSGEKNEVLEAKGAIQPMAASVKRHVPVFTMAMESSYGRDPS